MDIKLKKVSIDDFRNLTDLRFELGSRITVLSGHNGVGKSSLLSLIASTTGTNKKRLDKKPFQPEFDDYFTINSNEPLKEYRVVCEYEASDGFIFAKRIGFRNDADSNRGVRALPRTSPRIDSDDTVTSSVEKVRNKLGITDSARVPIPTIYLSLSRLYPTGETVVESTVMRNTNAIIQKGFHKKYAEWYNEVLPNSISEYEHVESMTKKVNSKKRIFVPPTNASAETQSVGQDNIGYIVNALVDFYSLSLSDDYHGGVLCIDEVDASLHPSAQVNLFNLLNRLSNELNLQIFLTSHSLTILKEIISLKEKCPSQYQLVYFKGVSTPSIMKFNSYRLLKADLFQELTFKKPETKVYCEDEMTKAVFNLLVNAAESLNLDFKLPPYKIIPIFLGADQLKKLPRSDTHFSNVAIVLDGDANSKDQIKIEDYMKDSTIVESLTPITLDKNFVSLPGYLSPEGYLYSIIYELVKKERNHYKFWRTLDEDPETTLYSSDKIEEKLLIKDSELCLKTLKAKKNDLISFASDSNMLSYYYSTKNEDLTRWIKGTQKVFEYVSNRIMASRV